MDGLLNNSINKIRIRNLVVWISIGVLTGLTVTTIPPLYLLSIAGGLILVMIFRYKPELTVLTIVVLTSSIIFENALPLVPIGVGSLHIADILLLFALFMIIVRRFSSSPVYLVRTPLDLPLLLFLCMAIVSVFVSLYHDVGFNDVMRSFRFIAYYLLFYIITNLIRDRKQLVFMIKGLVLIGTVVTVAMICQSIVGESIKLMPGRVETAGVFGQEFDSLRILPPGQTLLYCMLLTVFSLYVLSTEKPKIFSSYLYLLVLLSVGECLTYTRSHWATIVAMLFVFAFIVNGEGKKKIATFLITSACLIGLLFLAGNVGTDWNETFSSVSDRFMSLFAGKELTQSRSVDDRIIENGYAIESIKKSPLLGIGLRNDYRPNLFGPDDDLEYYVHNVYLWIMTDMGILGLLAFIVFFTGFIIRAARNVGKIRDNFLKAAMTGFMLTGIGMLLISFFSPLFMEWNSIVVIAIIIGLTEAIIRNGEMVSDTVNLI